MHAHWNIKHIAGEIFTNVQVWHKTLMVERLISIVFTKYEITLLFLQQVIFVYILKYYETGKFR